MQIFRRGKPNGPGYGVCSLMEIRGRESATTRILESESIGLEVSCKLFHCSLWQLLSCRIPTSGHI